MKTIVNKQKEHKIGFCCSPAEHFYSKTYIITRFIISYGGGMGGTNKTLYCTKYVLNDKGFFNLTLLNGEKETINSKYVVSYKDVKVIEVVTDITEHINYREHVTDKTVLKHNLYMLPYIKDTYTLVDNYINFNDTKDIKLIDNWNEEITEKIIIES